MKALVIGAGSGVGLATADARRLGIRFVALAPRELIAGTRIGDAAAAAYGRDTGEGIERI
jgi:hypothetical protein